MKREKEIGGGRGGEGRKKREVKRYRGVVRRERLERSGNQQRASLMNFLSYCHRVDEGERERQEKGATNG